MNLRYKSLEISKIGTVSSSKMSLIFKLWRSNGHINRAMITVGVKNTIARKLLEKSLKQNEYFRNIRMLPRFFMVYRYRCGDINIFNRF